MSSAAPSSSSDSLPIATMIHMVSIKLSSNNFLLWKRQIIPMLTSFELLGFVNGTQQAPPPTTRSVTGEVVPNPDYSKWLSTDQRLLAVLFSTLSEEAMSEVVDCTTSREAWTALNAAFSHSSESRVHQLREELLSLRRGSLSVKDYGSRFKSICDQLSAVGKPVDESDKSHWFLRGLGAAFANFADARMSMQPVPSLSVLLHQAIQFDLMLKSMDPSESSATVAFMAKSSHSPSTNEDTAYYTDARSFIGGRTNNGGRGGRGGRGGGQQQQQQQHKPRCQICRGVHYADKCPLYLARAPSTHANLAEAFTSSCNISTPASDWYVDSGASAHMTSDPSSLDIVQPYSGNGTVVVGNGNSLHISHTGSTSINDNVHLLDVLVVPHITKNLLSISKLTNDLPVDVLFSDRQFTIQNRATKQAIAQGRLDRGLYVLDRGTPALLAAVKSSRSKASYELWHLRLGHVPFPVISLLNKLGHLSVTSILPTPRLCSPCQLAKSKRLTFDLNDKRADSVLELIHCDLWGPAPITSVDGFRYYAAFVDDFSRFTWLYPLKAKSDFYGVFLKFHAFVCNQFSASIKNFQSDGGLEFLNARLRSFFDTHGIHHRVSCPYTPQQNGRAERKHRHITETGLSMLFHAHAPPKLWFDAFATATFVINRLPSAILQNKSPFEVLFGCIPHYPNFEPFGCRVFPYLRDYSPHKLAPRSSPCIFLGYSSTYKGFRCYDPATSRTYITRHAQFDEAYFPFASSGSATPCTNLDITSFFENSKATSSTNSPPPSTTCKSCLHDSAVAAPPHSPMAVPPSSAANPPSPAADPPSPSPSSTENPPSTQNPTAIAPQSTHSMITRSKAGIFKPRYPVDLAITPLLSALVASTAATEPRGFKSASKFQHWLSAMQEEMDAIHSNNTWDLVPPPSGVNIVGSRWVFRTKYKADGSIERYKARLVAQGFTQVPGADFHHTFSPVVKASTVRIILALSVHYRWPLHQLDIKNAFLNGVLSKPVYMAQPPGFTDPRHPNHVCRLKKALYGLRQAPLAWFQRFSRFLLSLGFHQSRSDTSLFFLHRGNSVIFLLLYVDDIVLTGNNKILLRKFIDRASHEFALKDLGALTYFLGLEITSQPDGLFIGQAKYAHDILSRAQLLDSKPVATPLAAGISLEQHGSPFNDPSLYRSLVGALQYLTITRPDISYAVNHVSQFLHSPTIDHFEAVKRILRYVKGTVNLGLSFNRQSDLSLLGYSDANWARCVDSRRSTYGYSIFLGGNLVSWSAKKQPTVARSSCESEYRALANTAAELVWITNLLREIRVPLDSVPALLCDNNSAVFLSQNPVAHKRAKHIDIDYHFVRDLVSEGKLSTQFVPSHLQLADIFTKSLPRPAYELLRSKLCVRMNPTQSLRGDIKDNT